ncbi:hypothetical protein ABPG72_018806, partial [Tetrahymena utriculariae]
MQFADEDIEIDEVFFYKIKSGIPNCRLGKIRYYVFGINSRQTKYAIFYLVEKRDRQTLLPLIFKHCKNECRIFSECWASYVNIKTFPAHSYILNSNNNDDQQIQYHFCISHSNSY